MLPFNIFSNICRSLITKSNVVNTVKIVNKNNVRLLSSEVEKAKKAVRGNEETIFDKVVKKEIPADIIFEDEHCLAFNDIMPQAPTHFLVIPKQKLAMISDSNETHEKMLGHLLVVGSKLGKERMPNGFRVVINNGVHGCQSVYYIHVHVLGGRQMKWPPG